MNKHNHYSFGKRIKYFLSCFLSRGLWAQVLVLLIIVFILTLIFGIITMGLGEENYTESYWISLMHIIDQGTVTSDEKGTDAYFLFMLFITFVGMAITGTIIAIITSFLQGKLEEHKKGHSNIIEKGHVVILGFDENAYTICRELAEGSRIRGERLPIVVADSLDLEEMEQAVKDYYAGNQEHIEKASGNIIKDKKIKLILRSGDPISENTFSMCMVQTAKSIVINQEKDFDTIRILLSLATYLKRNNAYLESDNMPSIVAMIHNEENFEAAIIATGIDYKNGIALNTKNINKIQFAYDKSIQANLFAMSCINHDLPLIMDGLFNYRGSSLQIEEDGAFDEGNNPFIGKTFSEISDMVTDAIPLGFARNCADDQTLITLVPSKDRTYLPNDRLIYLSDSNRLHFGKQRQEGTLGVPANCGHKEKSALRSFLFIGSNIYLSDMAGYMKEYCLEGSTASFISSEEICLREADGTYLETSVINCDNPYDFENIKHLFEENSFWLDKSDSRHLTNIVILSPKDADRDLADEEVMLLLLKLRQYLKEDGSSINITSVMQQIQNQMIFQRKNDNDFVAVSDIANRMLAQVADDPRKYGLIENLLVQNGTSLELIPVSDYVDTGKEFNFEGVFTIAKNADDTVIPLGWVNTSLKDGRLELVLNPSGEELKESHVGSSFAGCQLIILKGKNS